MDIWLIVAIVLGCVFAWLGCGYLGGRRKWLDWRWSNFDWDVGHEREMRALILLGVITLLASYLARFIYSDSRFFNLPRDAVPSWFGPEEHILAGERQPYD